MLKKLQSKRAFQVMLIITLLASGLLMTAWSNNDLYFMFNHGRYILENGFPTTEPFTIHEGFSFSIQKWASCVTYWLIWLKTGWMGLVVTTAIIGMLRNVVFYYVLRPIAKNDAVCALLVLIYSAMMQCFTLPRPQQFSDVILLLEILLLEKYATSGKWKYLCGLPVLSLIEMQFHSTTWLIFFIVLIPYVVEYEFKFRITGVYTTGRYRKIPILLAGAASALAGLINPYGINTFFYIINEFRGNDAANSIVAELQPFSPAGDWKTTVLILVCIILWRFTSLRQRYAMFFLGTGFMTLVHLRSLETFLPFAIICLADMLPQLHLLERLEDSKAIRMLLYTVLAVVGGGFSLWACITDTYTGSYLLEYSSTTAIDWLVDEYGIEEENPVVYTSYNNGSYAEFRGLRTYIDSRSEVFQDSVNKQENIMDEYLSFLSGGITYVDLQEKYGFDYWIMDETVIAHYMSLDSNYEMLYHDLYGWTIFKYVGHDYDVVESDTTDAPEDADGSVIESTESTEDDSSAIESTDSTEE